MRGEEHVVIYRVETEPGSVLKKQFRKNKLALFSLRMIVALSVLALLADFIANEKPLVAKINGAIYFPALKSELVNIGIGQFSLDLQNFDWKNGVYEFVIFPPVPYLPKNMDLENAQSVSPFGHEKVKSAQWRHWLGTDELGHDVLAGMIHGARIAISVGLVSMGIAAFIGIFLGAFAGYFGDDSLRISRARMSTMMVFLLPAIFYAFSVRSFALGDALHESFFGFAFQLFISVLIFLVILFLANIVCIPLKRISFLKKKITIPADMIIMRLVETLISIPSLFLIISLLAIAKPSLYLVMIVIGFTSWTGIAKYIRAEILRIRELEYVEAAKALGFSSARTLLVHVIPNALAPVLIAVSFGVAGAILAESSLSFLGIGVPPETMTWGSLLASARVSPSAWWLAVFPGFAIFATVTLCNILGEGLRDAMDPKMRK